MAGSCYVNRYGGTLANSHNPVWHGDAILIFVLFIVLLYHYILFPAAVGRLGRVDGHLVDCDGNGRPVGRRYGVRRHLLQRRSHL